MSNQWGRGPAMAIPERLATSEGMASEPNYDPRFARIDPPATKAAIPSLIDQCDKSLYLVHDQLNRLEIRLVPIRRLEPTKLGIGGGVAAPSVESPQLADRLRRLLAGIEEGIGRIDRLCDELEL